jgi:hypothetical protein
VKTVFWQQAEIGEKLAGRARLEDLAPRRALADS